MIRQMRSLLLGLLIVAHAAGGAKTSVGATSKQELRQRV